MLPERPDMSQAGPELRAYVEALEAELARLRESFETIEASPSGGEPDEPPTTLSVVTLSAGGLIKRTPRHLYSRQRRGGMGVFDLELPDGDAPVCLALADEAESLVVLTERARAFRLPAADLPAAEVRARGQSLAGLLPLEPGERVVWALREQARGYLALLLQNGHARLLPAHIVGAKMVPGTALYRFGDFGPLVSACWTSGNDDLFVATRQGLAIRFPERALSLPGGLALRLDAEDSPLSIAAVRAEGGVLLLGADGRGTIRLMSGFNANKSPGAGGKLALKTERLAAAAAASTSDDVFIISRLGKIVRFRAAEIPAKEGVVQGVNCMSLRADETAALVVTPAPAAADSGQAG